MLRSNVAATPGAGDGNPLHVSSHSQHELMNSPFVSRLCMRGRQRDSELPSGARGGTRVGSGGAAQLWPIEKRPVGTRREWSISSECDEGIYRARICFAQGIQVPLTRCARRHQVRTSSPGKGQSAQLGHEQFSHQPRVAPIAVRERMNPDQPMMKPDGQFISGVDVVVLLVLNVVQQIPKLNRNLFPSYPDRLVA